MYCYLHQVVSTKSDKKDKKDKKEKKDKKDKKDVNDEKDESTVATEAAAKDGAEPEKKKRKRRNVERTDDYDPFAVKPKDPKGVTSDVKRQARVKTEFLAIKFVQNKVNLMEDLDLKQVKVENLEYDSLTRYCKEKYDQYMITLKWNELNRHIQSWANKEERIPKRSDISLTFPQCKDAKKRLEALVSKKRYLVKAKKVNRIKGKAALKGVAGKSDRKSDASSPESKSASSSISAAVTAPMPVATGDVAKRIQMAQEAAKARKNLGAFSSE